MGRPVILGNGALTVGLNEHGLVHDFYYPYVGLENLTTSRSMHHKIGVFVDGEFSWVDNTSWTKSVNFRNDALISDITLKNNHLNVELHFQDFVDSKEDVFCRILDIKNNSDNQRDIRIFMHQIFQISRGGRSDTALFVPEENYILDYKGRCSLLIYGEDSDGKQLDQFAVGNFGIEGKEGTFKDAEDGELSGSAVEHGGVDSVVRFSLKVGANSTETLNYWVVASDSQFNAETVHNKIKHDGLQSRLDMTATYWQQWLSIATPGLSNIDQDYRELTNKSLMIIKSHIDKRGGIIASCDSSIYNYGRDYYSYVWPRDGAFAIWPLIKLGYAEEPKAFFEFCRDTISSEGYMMHKYQPDKAIGSTWHPLLHGRHSERAIQEDESAIVVFMINQYLQFSNDQDFVRSLYASLIKPIADFMSEFIDEQTNLPHASYDLWEMKFGTSSYTTAITYRALLDASSMANLFDNPEDSARWSQAANIIASNTQTLVDPGTNALRQGFLLDVDTGIKFDNTIDSASFYGAYVFGLPLADLDVIASTAKLVEQRLLDSTPSKGLPRFEHDGYFLASQEYIGNPWIVTTLWYAQYRLYEKDTGGGRHYLEWAKNSALSSGVLSEQVDPVTGNTISVTPLVWSHAEFINTVLLLANTL